MDDGKILVAFIGLAGSIVGGLLVAGANWLQKRHEISYQREKDAKELWHSKLEDLHVELNEFTNESLDLMLQCTAALPTMPDTQLMALFASGSARLTKMTGHLHSMQQIYMPESELEWAKLAQLTSLFLQQLVDVCEQRLIVDPGPMPKTAQALQVQSVALTKLVTQKILKLGRL